MNILYNPCYNFRGGGGGSIGWTDRPSVKLVPQTMHSCFIRKRGYNIHLSQKLQGRALDIVMAYQEINIVIEDMTEIRNNIETFYK